MILAVNPPLPNLVRFVTRGEARAAVALFGAVRRVTNISCREPHP